MTMPALGVALNAASFAGAFMMMEGVAWSVHRFVMHGPLWALHRSHHQPRLGRFEANDLFAFFFAGLAILMFYAGAKLGLAPLWWAGAGATGFGLVYALFHDGVVHQRFGFHYAPRSGYLKRLVQAHRLHHAVHAREGGVSFGFLYAPDARRLKVRLSAQRGGLRRGDAVRG